MSDEVFVLSTRAVIRLEGNDAATFIHDVLTPKLPEKGTARWWALLSPQGKIQAEGLLVQETNSKFFLEAGKDIADALFKRLRLYKLRADFEMVLEPELGVLWTGNPKLDSWHMDSRTDGLGAIKFGQPERLPDGDAIRHLRLIHEGIASQGLEFLPDSAFPHDIGMDHLGGIDFKKGCYIGQEVVSRMQHRGTARRRPVILDNCPPGAAGRDLSINGRSVGSVGPTVDGKAIAIARIDRIHDGETTVVDEQTVSLVLPNWATYTFADSKDTSTD